MPDSMNNRLHTHTHKDILSIRRWFSYMTLEGAFAAVFIVFSGNAFLTGLAIMWGANDFEIGLLAAMPFIAQLAQLFSTYLIDATGKRKAVTFWGLFIGRQLWWVLIPLLFIPGDQQLHLLIILVALSSICVMIATPGWLSWMADLVPDKIRGRYFGVRSATVAISTIVSTIAGGAILDYFRNRGNGPVGFAIIISSACAAAFIGLMFLNRLPRMPQEIFKVKFSFNRIIEPFKDSNYRKLLMIFFSWNFAIGVGAAFFIPHMLQNLHLSFTQISLYLSAAALTAILLNKPWGIVIDKFGSKPVLAFCAFGIVLVPLLWYIPQPGNAWFLGMETIYSGTLWTGFNLAAFNIPIANSPRNRRIAYLSIFSVVTGLGFFIASLIGGTLAETLSNVSWHLGTRKIVNYHIIFTISAFLRLIAAFLSLKFHEPREKRIPVMIQFMGYSVLKRLSIGRQLFPWALNKKERDLSKWFSDD